MSCVAKGRPLLASSGGSRLRSFLARLVEWYSASLPVNGVDVAAARRDSSQTPRTARWKCGRSDGAKGAGAASSPESRRTSNTPPITTATPTIAGRDGASPVSASSLARSSPGRFHRPHRTHPRKCCRSPPGGWSPRWPWVPGRTCRSDWTNVQRHRASRGIVSPVSPRQQAGFQGKDRARRDPGDGGGGVTAPWSRTVLKSRAPRLRGRWSGGRSRRREDLCCARPWPAEPLALREHLRHRE